MFVNLTRTTAPPSLPPCALPPLLPPHWTLAATSVACDLLSPYKKAGVPAQWTLGELVEEGSAMDQALLQARTGVPPAGRI